MFISSKFIAITFFHNSSLTIFFQIFSIIVPISSVTRLYLVAIRSFEKIGWYSFLTNFVEGASKLIFLIIFIFLGIGTLSVHFSYVLGTLVMLIGSFLVMQYTISIKPNLKDLDSKKIKKELFSYSWPLVFVYIVSTLSSWIDVFIIGIYKPLSAVGIYNAAIPIAILVLFVPNIFIQLFSPMINRYYANKKLQLINKYYIIHRRCNSLLFIVKIILEQIKKFML